MNLDTLESMAKQAQADARFDHRNVVCINPETILALIALLREMGAVLGNASQEITFEGCSYYLLTPEDKDEAITKYKEMTNEH